jgi:hypothetical protein
MAGRVAVLVAIAGAMLALSGNAAAVDHVTLFVAPSKLSADWKLSAAVVGATSPTGRETFGVTLTRTLANGRGEEQHGLRAAPAGTVTFDGRRGRWQARFGALLTIGMTVTATGPAQELAVSQGCRGAFARVPVALRGSFVLRTGTMFFGTVRRARLTGSVTFNRSGPVDCAPATAATCAPSTVLSAVRQAAGGPAATLLLSPDAGGWITLSFADRGGPLPAGVTWYHVMRLERLGFDPLAGTPLNLDVRLPAALAVRGSGTFTASETSTDTRGACHQVAAEGTFTGSFRTRFAGWGARAAVFGPAAFARYAHESA